MKAETAAVQGLLLETVAATRTDLQEAFDLTDGQLDSMVESRILRRPFPNVFVLGPGEPSDWVLLVAATLAAAPAEERAVISHRSAGRWWGLRGVTAAKPEVTVTSTGRTRASRVVIHRTDVHPPQDLHLAAPGVNVTTVAKTIFDLGSVLSPLAVERAFEDAFFRELVDWDTIVDTLGRNRGTGRRGAATLARILADRDPEQAAADGELELALKRFIRRLGIEDPTWQYELVLRGVPLRLDAAWIGRKRGLEANSRLWHSGRLDVARNSRKARVLTLEDWKILPYAMLDLRQRPVEMAAELRDFLA